MSKFLLAFEAPLKEIEDKINELKSTSTKTGMDVSQLVLDLENKLELILEMKFEPGGLNI